MPLAICLGVAWILLSITPCWGSPPSAGDLVFRQGTEPISDAVMALDQGGYSHVGLLVGQPNEWQILHAVPDDGVTLEPLAEFTAPDNASHYAVLQVDATPVQRSNAIAYAFSRLGLPFKILPADASRGSGIYCTLLIHDAWAAAGLDLQAPFKNINMPLARGRYLLPSGLMDSPVLHSFTTCP
ncbi:YiiX/YebB-like N1pC/P60 family cysteine hydrolase [Halomonas sabkhae]|uniref:YiiX/YebB-like N1pC/P60 family cysteine hydrolase n=1 Tax=Halomonas sabkhae TaxID=626223 RepID=UPI0025B5BC4F|nr:YiiX/YebB-like N1pC/P60 family cysteine hydrolase [Halomonas sabkhae]MDN3525277.1 YiiX/YebB-like N1pC/P60 family cysteine hydrolase [Halomonas sabkhae]